MSPDFFVRILFRFELLLLDHHPMMFVPMQIVYAIMISH